jgi:prophage antirepressor-like protein
MPELLNIFPGIADKQYFQNPDTKEFWFHATAVCKEMGFENTSRTLMMYCDDDEKFQEIYDGKATWFISEAGIYGLAMISKTEQAKKFKRWLKHEVLPKLRSQGLYVVQNDGESLASYKARETALIEHNDSLLKQNKSLHEANLKAVYRLLTVSDKKGDTFLIVQVINSNFGIYLCGGDVDRIFAYARRHSAKVTLELEDIMYAIAKCKPEDFLSYLGRHPESPYQNLKWFADKKLSKAKA